MMICLHKWRRKSPKRIGESRSRITGGDRVMVIKKFSLKESISSLQKGSMLIVALPVDLLNPRG